MDVFNALAEPTRRDIIEILAQSGQLSATEIYEKFSSTPPAVSQHLKILKEAKLVTMEKHAQKHVYQINPKAKKWIKKMMLLWNERFDRLDKLI